MVHKEYETDKFLSLWVHLYPTEERSAYKFTLWTFYCASSMFSSLSRCRKAFWLRAVKPFALLFITSCKRWSRADEHGLLNIDEQDAEKFDCQTFHLKVEMVAPLAINRKGGAEGNYGICTCRKKQGSIWTELRDQAPASLWLFIPSTGNTWEYLGLRGTR